MFPSDYDDLLKNLKLGITNQELYKKYSFNPYVGIKARKGNRGAVDLIIITWNRAESLYPNEVDLKSMQLTYIGAGLGEKQLVGRQNSTLLYYFDHKSDIPVIFCSKINTEIKYISMLKYTENGYKYPDDYDKTFRFVFQMFDVDSMNLLELLSIMPGKKPSWELTKSSKTSSKEQSIQRIIQDQKLRDLIKELQFIGDLGELLVLEYEYSRLKSLGLEEYAEIIEHTSLKKGHGYGYDILSYDIIDKEVKPIYIEVKSTTLDGMNSFYMTQTEYNKMNENKLQYRIYRVYDMYESSERIQIYKYPYECLRFVPEKRLNYKVLKEIHRS